MKQLKSKPPDIDRLIHGVKSISENRFSLSEEEIKLLIECVDLLEGLKNERTMDMRRVIFSKAIEILLRIFKDDIHNQLDKFM